MSSTIFLMRSFVPFNGVSEFPTVGDERIPYLAGDASVMYRWNSISGSYVPVNYGMLTPGPSGSIGPTGIIGPSGSVGMLGPSGPVGMLGPEGEPGPSGPIGPSGSQGPAGPQGPMGPPGPPGTGPSGSQGPEGPQGPMGPSGSQGPEGPQGPMGPSGSQGPEGPPNGPDGPIGPDGPTGQVGPDGPPGIAGPAGPSGPQGPVGPSGSQGPVGPSGSQGPVGPSGSQGPVGPSGSQGPTGPQGTIGPPGTGGSKLVYSVTGSKTYYVSSGAGSDVTGTGDVAFPWKTLSGSLSALRKITIAPETAVTLQLSNGNYSGITVTNIPYHLTIRGNSSTPTTVVITSNVIADSLADITLEYLMMNGGQVATYWGGVIKIGTGFRSSYPGDGRDQLKASYGGVIQVLANYSATSPDYTKSHICAVYGGKILYSNNITLTLVSDPTFSPFAAVTAGGVIQTHKYGKRLTVVSSSISYNMRATATTLGIIDTSGSIISLPGGNQSFSSGGLLI